MYEYDYYARYYPTAFFQPDSTRGSTYEAVKLVGPALWWMPVISWVAVAAGLLTSDWTLVVLFGVPGVLSTALIAGSYAVCALRVLLEQRRYDRWLSQAQAFWRQNQNCLKGDDHHHCLPVNHPGWELAGEVSCQGKQAIWKTETRCQKGKRSKDHSHCLPLGHPGWEFAGVTPCHTPEESFERYALDA